MDRILVTGSQGLLGSILVPHLKDAGYEVICHARKGDADVLLDLIDSENIDKMLDKLMPNVIVNLAALANVDECERNPQLAYSVNVRVIDRIVKWIRKNDNLCHLVHLSTDQMYDGAGPHKEEDITLSNYYGYSKYLGDLLTTTASGTVLRTNFFGPSKCPGRISLSDWLIQSLTNGEPIRVFEDVKFSPLTMKRLVELIKLVIEHRRPGTYNVGSREGMSKADFAFSLAKALDLPSQAMSRDTSDNVKLTAYRPKDMRMDSSLFEKVFNVELPTLKEEIQSLAEKSM